jgi:hypothetical protein
VIIFVGFLSCSSDTEMKAENEELRKEISLLKDSIENLTTSSNPYYLAEILQVDTSKGLLGNLSGDTLVLDAHFSECGEFGGDREWIKIFRESDATKCIIICDSIDCENDDYANRYTRIDSSSFLIDRGKELLIIKYLNKLTQFSFLEQEPWTNALNSYSAEVIFAFEPFHRRPYYVSLYDWSMMWPEFVKLRNALKN